MVVELKPFRKGEEFGQEQENSSAENSVLGSTQSPQKVIADPQQVVLGEVCEEDSLPPCRHLEKVILQHSVTAGIW